MFLPMGPSGVGRGAAEAEPATLPAASRAPNGEQVVFFAPDVTDASTIKRAGEFLDQGYRITVCGFRRERYNRGYEPEWPCVILGRTEDGNYRQRVRALLSSVPVLLANRRRLRDTAIIHARNIDQLLLAVAARGLFCRRASIVYEVLDIPSAMVSPGSAGALLRLLERLCLRRIRLLIVSSPAFFRCYYAAVQGYRREWFLLENKLPRTMAKAAAPLAEPCATERRRHHRYKWVVGYFGLIRGRETFELMARVAERLSDTVLFKFRGILTTVDPDAFWSTLRRSENMVYEGEYVIPHDLGEIYAEVDFAWALDLEHVEHNSRWLRPCRFYEAGLHGVPCLAMRGFEIGVLIDSMHAGWTFSPPLEDALVRFFDTLTPAQYEEKRRRLRSLPASTFVSGEDVAALCRIFDGWPKPRAPAR